MALSARPMGLPSVPGAATGQVPSVGRSSTSASQAPISELSAQADVHPEANFNFYDFTDWMQHRKQGSSEPVASTAGQFEVNSTTFASLLNQQQIDEDIRASTQVSKRSFQSILSKAIRAYEGTASAIHNQSASRGASLSLSL